MKTTDYARVLENGSTVFMDRDEAASGIAWSPHPRFGGVCLKHVVRGADTAGLLSCHVVKIEPGAVLEDHAHEDQWELHEVVSGEGRFILGPREMHYRPGHMAIIPKGVRHKVIAGESGLLLLAKFFPALL